MKKPLPRVGPDTAPFWAATRDSKLRLPFCTACGRAHWPGGPVCPFCLSDDLEWRAASGRGRVSTFTVIYKDWFAAFAADIPYNVAQVELEEGPRLTANVVELGAEELRIDMPVEVVFDPISPDVTLPRFRPRREDAA